MKFELPDAPPHSVTITVDGTAFPIVGLRSLSWTDEAPWSTTVNIEADCLENVHWDWLTSRIELRIVYGEVARNFRAMRCLRIADDEIWLDCVDPNRWPCESQQT